jgi:2-polyprenyl-3-methyl-5-hydroxy-6-metoxy-1,4-benzoquinol methylase
VKDQDNLRACPLCAAEDFEPFRFGLLQCRGCGLVVDPAIFQSGAAEALNEEAFGEAYDTGRSFWVRSFEAVKNRRYLANLRRAGVTGGRLLEVGVGRGSFLAAAREAGFEVEGCDLSASLCRRVQQATGITVHNMSLEQLPQGAYDVVAMHHVLEHVADPVGFLRAASERLKPGGVLHVAVPNVACWEARLRGWNSYEPYHVLYFDPHTLVRAIKASRYQLVRLSTFEAFSVWFLAIIRSLRAPRRASASAVPAQNAAPPAAVVEHAYRLAMVITGLLTWPLRRVQGWLGKGDELMAVARRES